MTTQKNEREFENGREQEQENQIGKKSVKDCYPEQEGSAIDTVKRNVAEAVKVTQGDDKIIEEIEESDNHLGSLFKEVERARFFVVQATSSTCTHEPECVWLYQVFHYLDRSVVLKVPDDLFNTPIHQIVERLTAK